MTKCLPDVSLGRRPRRARQGADPGANLSYAGGMTLPSLEELEEVAPPAKPVVFMTWTLDKQMGKKRAVKCVCVQ